uniref:Secreted protein n=1 Tax=Setaria viridis TaxID=4556 RepID=A0A4U6WCH2_SETVI|nr:hypothetical protein SEVIR_1G132150v2 [Setaria viridis]
MRGSQGAAASSCRCLLMSCCRAAAPCPVQVLFLVDIRKNWILIRSNFCASRTFWRKLILLKYMGIELDLGDEILELISPN